MVRTQPGRVDGAALSGRDREVYVAAMFDKIAGPYDGLNRTISLGRDRRWRAIAIAMAGIGPGARVMDLGCGTGDFIVAALPALRGSGHVVGIDLAPKMIEIARAKLEPVRGGVEVELRTGRADATGMPDGWADAVTMAWVVRNLGDRRTTYAEILRVLRPGGVFVSLDSSRPASALSRAGLSVYLRAFMPIVVRMRGGDAEAYRYLAASTERFLSPPELAAELGSAGFGGVSWRTLMAGAMAIHLARKPS